MTTDRSSGDGPTHGPEREDKLIAAAFQEVYGLDPGRIGPYRIIRRIGAGGMGVVYEAEQTQTERRVALKLIRLPAAAGSRYDRMFRREIQVLARLRHPCIAQIFDAGLTPEGEQYSVMELVDGIPLDEYCQTAEPSLPDKLALFVRVCEAVQYAHQRGVIHRDLKPANILVDREGVPHVLDFGLARLVNPEGEAVRSTTHSHGLIGTLRYMSPEQIQTDNPDLDVRTDVYSLGVTFYQMLTGRLPYETTGSMRDVLDNILNAEPRRPSTLSPVVDDELETITLKCLSKERDRRYQAVGDLARDIEHYLAGRPIEAKRDSNWYVFRKAVRRHQVPVIAGIAFVLLLAVSAVILSLMYYRAESQAGIAEAERKRATAAERDAVSAREAAQEQAQILYFGQVAAAQSAFDRGDMVGFRSLLESCPAELRGWEWRYLEHLRLTCRRGCRPLDKPGYEVRSVAVSPDGSRIVAGQTGGTVSVWETATGTQRVLNTPAGEGSAVSVTLSPDGSRIFAGFFGVWQHRTMKLWDAASGQALWSPQDHPWIVLAGAFSPNGDLLAFACHDGKIRIWDAWREELLREIPMRNGAWAVQFSPDGERIIVGGAAEGQIWSWNVSTGQESPPLMGHGGNVHSVAFSPDGRYIASGASDATVRLWDAHTGRQLRLLVGHLSWVSSVAFSPDGQRLLSGSGDGTIKLWDVDTGAEILMLRGHDRTVRGAAFLPDGRRIVCATSGAVEVWELYSDSGILTFPGPQLAVHDVAISPNSRLIAGGTASGAVIWEEETGVARAVLPRTARTGAVAFSPTDEILATASNLYGEDNPHVIKLWDTETWQLRATLSGHEGIVTSLDFTPDGKLLASGDQHRTIKLWDLATYQECAALLAHYKWVHDLAFSPDGHTLTSAGWFDGTVKLWDVAKRPVATQPVATLGGDIRRPIFGVAVSPDGKSFLSAGSYVRIWDFETHEEVLAPLSGHGMARAWSVAFSPDGKRVLAGCHDGTVRLWDRTTGTAALSLRHGREAVSSAVFSPDGTAIVSGCEDGTVRVWRTATDTAETVDEVDVLQQHFAALTPQDGWPYARRLGVALVDRMAALGRITAESGPEYVRQQIHQARLAPRQATAGRDRFLDTLEQLLTSRQEWSVAGPFSAPAGQEGFDCEFAPEKGIDLDAAYQEITGPSQTWRSASVREWEYIDLLEHCPGENMRAVAYAVAYMDAGPEQDVVLRFGGSGAIKAWLNSQPVYSRPNPSPFCPGEDEVLISLRRGPNELLVKVENWNNKWGFSVETVDANGWPLSVTWLKKPGNPRPRGD